MKKIKPNINCSNKCLVGDRIVINYKVLNINENAVVKAELPYKVNEINDNGITLSKDFYINQNGKLSLEFIAYTKGKYELKPIYFNVDGIDYLSEEITLNVVSTSEAKELMDIVGPQKIKPSFWYYFYVSVGTISFLLIMYLVFKKLKRKSKKEIIINLSPYDAAMKKFAKINDDNKVKKDIKKFVSRVSEVVKVFINDEYSIDVLDQTTTEFMYSLKNKKLFELSVINKFKEFFTKADFIKFKESFDYYDREEFLKIAKELVISTKKKEEKESEI